MDEFDFASAGLAEGVDEHLQFLVLEDVAQEVALPVLVGDVVEDARGALLDGIFLLVHHLQGETDHAQIGQFFGGFVCEVKQCQYL